MRFTASSVSTLAQSAVVFSEQEICDAALVNYGLVLVLLSTLLVGCGSFDPYETQGGTPTRLNGSEATVRALTVSEALHAHPSEPVYVLGYLIAPPDDEHRMCARLEKSGACRGDSLVVDTSRVDLWAASALEAGCCAIGLWSPHPLVLRLRLKHGRRALVLG